MNDLIKYGFSLGRVHVLEETMLSQNHLERLLEATDLTEKLQVLEETIFGEFLSEIKTEDDIEEGLQNYLNTFFRLLDELGDETISRYFRLGQETENTKLFYQKRSELAKKSGIELLNRLVQTEIDLANIRIWWRKSPKIAKKLIEGGMISKKVFLTADAAKKIAELYRPLAKLTEVNAPLLEKDLDNCILLILREQKYEPVRASRLIAFLKAKEIEVKNVRLILFGSLNNFPREITEGNLRYLYA